MVSKTASFKEFYFSFVSGVGEKQARELEKISHENRFIMLYNSYQPVLVFFFYVAANFKKRSVSYLNC